MRLTKHHGLGNDFLVLLDPAGEVPLTAEAARALCDRRRGVGADGVMRAGPGSGGADVTMELRNADGGPAEMSGNGIRCLAQAVARSRGAERLDLVVATAAGPRAVSVRPGPDARTALVEVDMGVVKVERDDGQWGDVLDHEWGSGFVVDVGNPHLVLLHPSVESLEGVDVAQGSVVDAAHPGGINVEFVAPDDRGGLRMAVWERGVGITEACGTGAVAAAAARRAHLEWTEAGVGDGPVRVSMPGGSVEVRLGETATLVGPATFVADVEVPWP